MASDESVFLNVTRTRELEIHTASLSEYERKIPFERLRCSFENNIKIGFRIYWLHMDPVVVFVYLIMHNIKGKYF